MKWFSNQIGLTLIAALLFANFAIAGKSDRFSKSVNKQYDVNADATLAISNKYGDVNISTWDQNSIKIDIEVSLSSPSLEKAQKKLDQIDFEFSNSASKVSAKTIFSGKGNYKDLDIIYTVKIPVNASVDLVNKFGDIDLTEINGTSKIYVSYGDLKGTSLKSESNDVTVKYGKIYFQEIKYLNCLLRYSKLDIKKVQWLKLDSKYSDSKVDGIGLMDLTSAYDDIHIRALAKFNATSKFSDLKLEKVTKNVEITNAYGEIDIKYISKGFDNVKIKSSYADIDLGFESGSGFNFDGSASFADIDLPSNSNVTKNNTYTSESYKGTVGNNISGNVSIKSSYGDIDIEYSH